MARIALTYMKLPMAIGVYFEQAFRETGHRITTVCPYTGTYMPWKGGCHMREKYAIRPDYEIPWEEQWDFSYADAEERFGLHDIDLWVSIDARYHLKGKPTQAPLVVVATDPHSDYADYSEGRKNADLFFNMQRCYLEPGDIWLPYAYSPRWHYPVEAEREHDLMCIGADHPHRIAIMLLTAWRGYKGHHAFGLVFDEARELYAKTRLILNWSVKDDTNARVFEAMAMGRALVTNRTPDLEYLPFEDEIHYMGFDGVDECLDKMEWLLAHDDERKHMEEMAYKAVLPHSYNARVKQILEMI